MAEVKLPEWFVREEPPVKAERIRPGFIEKNINAFFSFTKEVVSPERSLDGRGLLQAVSPGARVAGIAALMLGAVLTHSVFFLVGVGLIVILSAYLSKVPATGLLKRVVPSFLFTLVMVMPVVFDFFTPGGTLFTFKISGVLTAVTREGVNVAALLILRVSVAASLAALLFLSTKESEIFTGLRHVGVPRFFVTALFMTLVHTLILLKTAGDISLARLSRTIRPQALKDRRMWLAGGVVYLLQRALSFSKETAMAMEARGFTGTLVTMEGASLRGRDYVWMGFAFFVFFISVRL